MTTTPAPESAPRRRRTEAADVRRRRPAAGAARRRSASPTPDERFARIGSWVAASASPGWSPSGCCPLGGCPWFLIAWFVLGIAGHRRDRGDERRPHRGQGPGRRVGHHRDRAGRRRSPSSAAIVFVVVAGWRGADHPNFFTHDMSGVGPQGPLRQRRHPARDRRHLHRARHRRGHHAAARHRHRGLHDRGRRPVRPRRADRRRGDDGAAVDRRRAVRLHRPHRGLGQPRSGLRRVAWRSR